MWSLKGVSVCSMQNIIKICFWFGTRSGDPRYCIETEITRLKLAILILYQLKWNRKTMIVHGYLKYMSGTSSSSSYEPGYKANQCHF